jgi:hypothetical protein
MIPMAKVWVWEFSSLHLLWRSLGRAFGSIPKHRQYQCNSDERPNNEQEKKNKMYPQQTTTQCKSVKLVAYYITCTPLAPATRANKQKTPKESINN